MGLNEMEVQEKMCDFQTISRRIEKQCKIGPRLLLITNRKTYVLFRLLP